MNTIIIAGSARNDGNTMFLTQQLTENTSWDCINLNDYDYSYYDYEHKNREDDFLPLLRSILERYDAIIFATPVYWYSMSGIMKVFLDRISDVLTIEKELGRKFRGKKMAVVSTSNGNNLGANFWLPFIHTADYLGMDYMGGLHTIAGADNKAELSKFVQSIKDQCA